MIQASVSGRRLFKDRREREALAVDPSKLIREMESNLSRRIGLLESEVSEQTKRLQLIAAPAGDSDEKFQRLLSAMETFWAQAPRPFPQLPPATEVAPTIPMPPPPPITTAPIRQQGWSVLGVSVAVGVAIALGAAYPEIQRQFVRFASVESLSIQKPKAPAPPPIAAKLPVAVASHAKEPFSGPSIPLDVPASLKAKVQSEAHVNVLVAIDNAGNVTEAHVESSDGESASLLEPEALRAARESHFRPAREGAKPVESKMLLTYRFKPEAVSF